MPAIQTEAWTSRALDELVPLDRPICYGVLKPGDYVPSGVPLIRILDLEGNRVRGLREIFRISPALDAAFARSRLAGEEILVSIQGTIGRIAIAQADLRDANISRTIARVAIGKGHSRRFLRHWLLSSWGQRALNDALVGTTRASLNIAELRAVKVPCPAEPEAECIADILDTVDDAIRQTERVIAKLEQVKAGMLRDLLTRGIDDNGEVRDPERYPEQFKDSPLGRIPKGWSHTPFATLIELLDHMRVPVNGDERAGRPGTVPYYGANGQQGWIDRPLFDEPLILLAEDGGNFEEFATRPIAYRISGPAWVNNHAHIIRAAAQTDQGFLFWSLVHKDIRRYIAGGTRSKLTQGELLSIELAAPPESEQRRIAERLDHHQSQLRQEAIALEKLRVTKQGLADDLLTGRVRVNTREAVPA
jgi:type I restriction enzyme S subunit